MKNFLVGLKGFHSRLFSSAIKPYRRLSDHSASTHVKFPEKLTFLTSVCVSKGKKCYFSENFAYVMN